MCGDAHALTRFRTLIATTPASYWIWRPEIAREMINRWISDVPSKIV